MINRVRLYRKRNLLVIFMVLKRKILQKSKSN